MVKSRSFGHSRSMSYDSFQCPPPLSNLLPASRNLEIPQVSELRASTPKEMGHIGSFKLGSLRVTNGAVSPDLHDRRASVPSIDHNVESRPALIQRHTLTASKPEWMDHDTVHELDASSPLTVTNPDPALAEFKFTESPPTSVYTTPNEERSMSPFSFQASPPGSPTLQATSKATAADDHLFEEEYTLAPEVDGVKSPVRVGQSAMPVPQTVSSLAKTDSGYSSSASGRKSAVPKDMMRVQISAHPTHQTSPVSTASSLSNELVMSPPSSAQQENRPLSHVLPDTLSINVPKPRSVSYSVSSAIAGKASRRQSEVTVPIAKLMAPIPNGAPPSRHFVSTRGPQCFLTV